MPLTDKQLVSLDGQLSLTSAAFSPDGYRLLSVSFDGTARVVESSTGRQSMVPVGHRLRIADAWLSP